MKARSGNFELLRIVAMLAIILIHLLGKSAAQQLADMQGIMEYLYWTYFSFCLIGVNCFIMISGYFYIENKFKIKKLFILIIQVFFYSVAIVALLLLTGIITEPVSRWRDILLPITHNEYWFISVYIALYLLSPFIGEMMDKISRQDHFTILFILTILYSVIPTVFFRPVGLEGNGSASLMWFIYLYMLGAYIRKHKTGHTLISANWKNYIIVTLLLPFFEFIWDMIHRWFGIIIKPDPEAWYINNSLFALLASVLLFMIFANIKNIHIINSPVILWFGRMAFAVYLIHNNRTLSRVIWGGEYAAGKLAVPEGGVVPEWIITKWYFPFYAIVLIIVIYALCSAIEFLRSLAFKPLEQSAILEKICVHLENSFNKMRKRVISG